MKKGCKDLHKYQLTTESGTVYIHAYNATLAITAFWRQSKVKLRSIYCSTDKSLQKRKSILSVRVRKTPDVYHVRRRTKSSVHQ